MIALQPLDRPDLSGMAEEDLMEVSTDFDQKITTDDDVDINLGDESTYYGEDELMAEGDRYEEDRDIYREEALNLENDDEMVDDLDIRSVGSDIIHPDIADVEDHQQDDLRLEDERQPEVEVVTVNDTESGFQAPATDKEQSSEPTMHEDLFFGDDDSHIASSFTHDPLSTHDQQSDHTELPVPIISDQINALPVAQELHQELTDTVNVDSDGTRESLHQIPLADSSGEAPSQENEITYEEEEDHDHDHTEITTANIQQDPSVSKPDFVEHPAHAEALDSNEWHDSNHQNEETVNIPTSTVGPSDDADPTSPGGATNLSIPTDIQKRDQPADNRAPGNTAQPIRVHPVVVLYQDSEMSLFPPTEHDEEHSQTYFLQDESLTHETLSKLLQACRNVLADSISDHEELEVEIPLLDLRVSEHAQECSSTSLAQILGLYLQLHHNDGIDKPEPLHLTLTIRSTFTHRLEHLYASATEGRGISHVTHVDETEGVDGSDEQDELTDGDKVQELDADIVESADGEDDTNREDRNANTEQEIEVSPNDHTNDTDASPGWHAPEGVVESLDDTGETQRSYHAQDERALNKLTQESLSSIKEHELESTSHTDLYFAEETTLAQAKPEEEHLFDDLSDTLEDLSAGSTQVLEQNKDTQDAHDAHPRVSHDGDHVELERTQESRRSSGTSSTIRGDGFEAPSREPQTGQPLENQANTSADPYKTGGETTLEDNDRVQEFSNLGSHDDNVEDFGDSDYDEYTNDANYQNLDADVLATDKPGGLDAEAEDYDLNLNSILPTEVLPNEGSRTGELGELEDETAKPSTLDIEEDEITYEDEEAVEEIPSEQGNDQDLGSPASSFNGSTTGSGILKRTRAAEDDIDPSGKTQDIKRMRSE